MKTKKVEFWCDLWPGWQDYSDCALSASTRPFVNSLSSDAHKRVKITVELPCIGGSAEETDAVVGRVEG